MVEFVFMETIYWYLKRQNDDQYVKFDCHVVCFHRELLVATAMGTLSSLR